MPRTSYSDFSLPNLEQDIESEKRHLHRKRLLIHKKKSRNIVKPNRKKHRTNKQRSRRTLTYKRAYSPEYKIQIYEEDSASFQSDCVERHSDNEFPLVSKIESIPFLSLERSEPYDRLREECERRELIEIMRDCRLEEQDL